jgi:hypothetical protein
MAVKKATTKKRVSEGDAMVCEVCGLSVVIEQVGDVAVREDNVLLCCSKPMKKRARKASATRKKASKAKATKK